MAPMNKNRLFIISGPSGSGKTSIARQVMSNEVVSFTTRPKRNGEVDGKDYIFISQDEFERLLDIGGLAEHTAYYGSAKYGITMKELLGKLSLGDAFVIVDVVGKQQLEKLYDNTVSIFVWMPDITVAKSRMELRGDDPEMIAKRLKTYDEELSNFYLYDYLIDNTGPFEESVKAFRAIVGGEFDT